jgi:copper(I)-binding protein
MTTTLRSLLLTAAVALVAGAGLAACGDDAGAEAGGSVRVTDATIDWPANPEVAAVRFVVRNDTASPDQLIGVESPVARSAMVHRSETDEEGRATMTMLDELEIPARSSVTFEPGGLHVMLTGITEDLQVGDPVEVTLAFAEAGDVTITAEVVEPGSQPAGSPAGEEDAHVH